MTSDDTTGSRQFFLALLNHIIWSTQTVASRYLQVYAEPIPFDGQGVLATSKATSAILVLTCGHVVCPEKEKADQNNSNGSNEEEEEIWDHRASSATSESASDDSSSDADEKMQEEEEDDDNDMRTVPLPAHKTTLQLQPSTPPTRTKIFFALCFGIVATCRAALNIASTKFTLSYYITAINSLTPLVVSIGDKILLKTSLPPAIWPCIFASILGCTTIAASQSLLISNGGGDNDDGFSFTSQDAIGCALQFMSMCFSAAARLLMKRTEHILSRNEAVQTNNACNFIFPLLYTLITNPGGWEAFRKMNVQSFGAWVTISVLVYTIGSTGQMSLVRSMGPGMYSSLGATRVLCSAILSAVWLNEPVQNWLEWIGLSMIMCTMTIYTLVSVDVRESWSQFLGTRNGTSDGDDDNEGSIFAFQLVPLKDEIEVDSSETRELL